MTAPSRRQFVRSLLAASLGALAAGCTIETWEGAVEAETPEELDAGAVLAKVQAAIAGKSREEVLKELDDAVMHHVHVDNCAETSFMALRDVFDLPDGGISRALTSFPGLGGRNETCGAVTGSLMAAGLVLGRDDKTGDKTEVFRALMPTRQICEAVEGAVGSTQCGDIVERSMGRRLDLFREEDMVALYSSPEGMQACFTSVLTAVHAAGELLMDAALA